MTKNESIHTLGGVFKCITSQADHTRCDVTLDSRDESCDRDSRGELSLSSLLMRKLAIAELVYPLRSMANIDEHLVPAVGALKVCSIQLVASGGQEVCGCDLVVLGTTRWRL